MSRNYFRSSARKAIVLGDHVHYNDVVIGFLDKGSERGIWNIQQPEEYGGAGETICGKKDAVARLVEMYTEYIDSLFDDNNRLIAPAN